MEPHPVPQNILDVEFKLFGAFTLKQFGKILAGCLIGIGIFLININILIKIPLVLISVFTGILLAIIPNFGVWLNGFIKALFVSPRYVWQKKTQTPEILSTQPKVVDVEKDRNISSSLNKKKLDINELPLDKLFGTQAKEKQVIKEDRFESPDGENLNDIYADVFGVTTTVAKRAPDQVAAPIQQKIEQEKPKMAMATQQPQPHQEVKMVGSPKFTTVEDYQAEINRLKYELSILTKDQNYKEKEEEIMSKINDLYTEIKLISGGKFTNTTKPGTPTVAVMQSGLEGQVIFGIVVNSSDIPLANVSIKFVNETLKKIFNTNSGRDGKFSTVKPLPPGSYSVFLQFPGKQFHAYNIEVTNKPLPAYKLREK